MFIASFIGVIASLTIGFTSAGYLPVGPDIAVVSALAVAVYILAVRLRLRQDKFDLYMAEEKADERMEYGDGT